MHTLVTSINIVLPLFLLIALGFFLRWRGVLSEEACARMNTVSFNVLIPAMIFYNIYTADLTQMVAPSLLLLSFVGVTVSFLLLLLTVPRFVKEPEKTGVVIQGAFRSSFVVLGMGLASSMYPGANLTVVAITSTVVAPMFSIYAVIVLELFSPEKRGLGHLVRSILTNPLIIASAAAILMLLTGLRLPSVLASVVGSLSASATTISLIVLGGSLSFTGVRGDGKKLAFACIVKLCVLPLIFVPIAIYMGFRGMELLTVLILFGSPGAVASYVMAVQAQGDGPLAGQIVVFTTCLSAFTLFGFIYTLISLGFL